MLLCSHSGMGSLGPAPQDEEPVWPLQPQGLLRSPRKVKLLEDARGHCVLPSLPGEGLLAQLEADIHTSNMMRLSSLRDGFFFPIPQPESN